MSIIANFTKSVFKHWNRLLKALVNSPLLGLFRKCVDVSLGDVV